MNVEIGTEAAPSLFWVYINEIFVAVGKGRLSGGDCWGFMFAFLSRRRVIFSTANFYSRGMEGCQEVMAEGLGSGSGLLTCSFHVSNSVKHNMILLHYVLQIKLSIFLELVSTSEHQPVLFHWNKVSMTHKFVLIFVPFTWLKLFFLFLYRDKFMVVLYNPSPRSRTFYIRYTMLTPLAVFSQLIYELFLLNLWMKPFYVVSSIPNRSKICNKVSKTMLVYHQRILRSF